MSEEALKSQGNEQFKAQNFENALTLYNQAIEIAPNNPVLYSNKAMTLIKLLRFNECIEACEKGLRVSQNDKQTELKLLWRLATSLLQLNDLKYAEVTIKKAITIDPNNQNIAKLVAELESKKAQQSQNIISIPIYEVDELPKEFQPQRKSKSHAETVSESSNGSSIGTTNLETGKTIEINSIIDLKYLISLQNRQLAYEALLSRSPQFYSQLFKSGNIESSMLDLFLDSFLFYLKTNSNSVNKETILSYLIALQNVPRFSIMAFSLNKFKIQEIEASLLESNLIDHQTLNKWK